MLVGPFDRRKKRSRCQACSTSHLKCSGQQPCANCERRRVTCTFPGAQTPAQPFILVERGKQQTVANWNPQKRLQQKRTKSSSSESSAASGTSSSSTAVITTFAAAAAAASPLSSTCRLTDDKLRYLHFFDVFINQNSFTGKGRSFGDDVMQLPELHSAKASHLTNAMLSLGALHAVKLGAPDPASRNATLSRALEYYTKSIIGLRDALGSQGKEPAEIRDTVLWSTLFLGLFELTNDSTGHGWRQHIIYGTSKALEASGPAACRTGAGRRFFMQARVFEICRTITSNENTFLTRPEWLEMSRGLWRGEGGSDWRPLDSLLDVMVMCSNLRVRASDFIDGQEEKLDAEPSQEAREICRDGFSLRQALNSWHASYGDNAPGSSPEQPPPTDGRLTTFRPVNMAQGGSRTWYQPAYARSSSSSSSGSSDDDDDSMLVARTFWASMSIYLSGVFDYEIEYWHHLGLATPSLDEATVQRHVAAVLELTQAALDTTTMSPLLFLFPLRIAGARARMQWQRDCILAILKRIEGNFAISGAVVASLAPFWRMYPVVDAEVTTDPLRRFVPS